MAPRRQGPTQTEVVRRSPFAGHSGRGLVIISIASFIMLGTVGFQSVFVEESTSRNTRQHVQQALLHSRGASSEAPDQAIKVVASGGEAGVSRGPSKGLGTTAPPEAAPGAGKFPTSDHWLNMSKPSRDLAGVLKMKNPKNDTDITTIDLTNLPVYKQEVFRGKVTPQTKVRFVRMFFFIVVSPPLSLAHRHFHSLLPFAVSVYLPLPHSYSLTISLHCRTHTQGSRPRFSTSFTFTHFLCAIHINLIVDLQKGSVFRLESPRVSLDFVAPSLSQTGAVVEILELIHLQAGIWQTEIFAQAKHHVEAVPIIQKIQGTTDLSPLLSVQYCNAPLHRTS